MQEGKTPKGRTWSWAFELLDELRDSGADEETYSSAICAAMEATRVWSPFNRMVGDTKFVISIHHTVASHVICDSACQACQKASRWQPALSLLNDLRQMPRPVDLGAYRAAMVACDRGGEPLQAMWLLVP